MKPVLLSSGDVLADRRAEYGEMLLQAGDAPAAADLFRQALERAPGWAAGWFRLGEIEEAAGNLPAAFESWRRALGLDPADPFGVTLKLKLAGQAGDAAVMPSAFVETLFDAYADDFDHALVERLGYAAPDRLVEAISEVHGTGFAKALDLGCGTGLMGARLRAITSHLEGVDISAEMLRKAAAKGIYDRLEQADLTLLEPWPGIAPDLVTAADVFMYLGELERVFQWIAATLAPGGLFGFTVEAAPAEEDIVLRPSLRYAHGKAYVCKRLESCGLDPVSMTRHTIRMDRGEPVEGLVVVAMKPAMRPSALPGWTSAVLPDEEAAKERLPAMH
ncbi:methyltransferase [Zhengella sp. ZM62]|uniref:methyltransferase n=1 Tax=Zhengella sedimenti TaxID=3390035 RepID=UPI003975FAFA